MTEPWVLGRYEIVAELGKGARGVVYRANDPMLNRILAIKTINTEEAGHEGMAEYEARFYTEAKAAGSLNHPNIIIIYDIGKSGHLVYMAMEYIDGRELRELLAQGQSLPVVQAVDIAAQVGEGLAYAHQHQVVHRDIKPANIMITPEGRAKIADFGIARMRSSETRTQTGVIMGSPKYISPEQVVGQQGATAPIAQSPGGKSGEEDAPGPSPTKGISRAFDSQEATQRLMRQIGADGTTEFVSTKSISATSISRDRALRPGERPWGQRENVIMAATVGAAVVLATLIALV